MSRNNAKFPLEVFSYLDSLKVDPKFKFLKSYQNYLREYYAKFVPDAGKGILVYHGMGLGKSISGACIALEQNKPVIFLMSKSLVNNMKSEIAKYIKLRIEHDPDVVYTARGKNWDAQKLQNNVYEFIDDKFNFVSFNASNMKDQLHRILRRKTLSGIQAQHEAVSLNGYCLVVDEAHNLFRSIINGSINGTEVYDLAISAKNATLIFLTGTPINNDPFEMSACFNMLDNGCLPDNYHDFKTHFVSEDIIKNKGKFQNRIFGLVSFVSNEGLKGIPKKLPAIVRIIPMSQQQYAKYKLARDLEMQEGQQSSGRGSGPAVVRNTPSMQKPSSGASSSYRTKSRQYSNYAPPGAIGESPELEEIDNAKIDSPKFKMMYTDLCKIGPAIIYSQYTGAGGIGAFAKYITARGWQEYNPVTGIIGGGNDTNFTLMEKMEDGNLSSSDYLQCRRSCGKIKGSAENGDTVEDKAEHHPKLSKVYAVISGAVSFEMRKKIEDEANKSDTKIWCILVSSTGAEGLNFLRRRYVGIMEPYWNYARIAQVAARAIRTNSHADLPEKERDVQICIYLSVSPDVKYEYHYWNTDELEFDDDFGGSKDSTTGKLEKRLKDFGGIDTGETDISLLADSIMDYRSIMSFLRALQEASFECKISGRSNCRVCAPNDTPLFTNKIARDIASDDPCREYESARVTAKKIEHEGVEYYYTPNDKKVYKFDPAVSAYREVFENEDVYFDLLKKIK